jgi:hypothetical protein
MLAKFTADSLRLIIKEPARRLAWRGNQYGHSWLMIRPPIVGGRDKWVVGVRRTKFD